jgi:LacI family transcriptional regulator
MNSQDNKPAGQRRRQATIIDVAETAGVAIGTVSRHLNGLPVRAANRDLIERAIADLGYRRNSVAVSMKTDTTGIVGLMVPSLGEFHAALLEKLSRKMRLTGRAVLSFCHDMQPQSITEGLEFFASHRVDALVIDGEERLRSQILKYVDEGLIVVLYDNDIPGLPVDRVFVENRKASARLVDHLLDLGHRRVATIHGNLRDSAARERLAGFHDAHASRGMAAPPELIVSGDWRETGGYACLRDLMTSPAPPTAVFSANYNMTLGALTWARENDVVIPDDLSLVSFDDIPAFRMHYPGITAVGQPLEKLADVIIEVLSDRLANPDAMGRSVISVDCDIILRGSAKRAP